MALSLSGSRPRRRGQASRKDDPGAWKDGPGAWKDDPGGREDGPGGREDGLGGRTRVRAPGGVVELWRIDLADRRLDELADRVLCAAERARAAQIVRPRKRLLWARSRGAVRELLGRYVERDPGELVFVTGPHGKPALAGEADLRFNLSHSGELMLVTVSDRAEVGVDVELAREPYSAGLLRAWTVREAQAKCFGTGLGRAPRDGRADGRRDGGADGRRDGGAGERRDSRAGERRDGGADGRRDSGADGHCNGELWTWELDLGERAFGAVAAMAGPRELDLGPGVFGAAVAAAACEPYELRLRAA